MDGRPAPGVYAGAIQVRVKVAGRQDLVDGVEEGGEFAVVFEWLQIQIVVRQRLQTLSLTTCYFVSDLACLVSDTAEVAQQAFWNDRLKDRIAQRVVIGDVFVGQFERHEHSCRHSCDCRNPALSSGDDCVLRDTGSVVFVTRRAQAVLPLGFTRGRLKSAQDDLGSDRIVIYVVLAEDFVDELFPHGVWCPDVVHHSLCSSRIDALVYDAI